MRSLMATLSICLAFLANTVSADKLTTDPNALPSASPALTAASTDDRLATKITYQSGYKRLHAVAEDLTASTKVKIYAGSNSSDWQIRDIPLIACVKDLPLGKLLDAIAESTHTMLSSETLESGPAKGTVVYRFYRTKKAQGRIDAKLSTAREAQLAEAAWAWDAMIRFAKTPQAQKEFAAKEPVAGRKMILVGKLLDSLGADAKHRVMGGETFSISGKDSPQAGLIHELCLAEWELMWGAMPRDVTVPEKPKAEAMDTAVLTVHLRDGGEAGETEIYAQMPAVYEKNLPFLMVGLRIYASHLDGIKSLSLPTRPKGEQVVDQEADRPTDPRLVELAAPEDWAAPLFAKTIKLAKPSGSAYLAFSDVVTALAAAAGLNVVTEDFLSQSWPRDTFLPAFDGQTTPAKVLQSHLSTWFVDADDNLIVGWVYTHGMWRKCHRSLVPESFLNKLTSADRLHNGLQLDDVSPVVSLTDQQRRVWLRDNRHTPWMWTAFRHDLALWQLYDSLSESYKALAKSDEGLSLAKLNAGWVARFLLDKTAEEGATAWVSNKKTAGDGVADVSLLLDSAVADTGVMRLKRVPATGRTFLSLGPTGVADGMAFPEMHHSYVIEIECQKDGHGLTIRSSDLGLALPIYSWKREQELYRAFMGSKDKAGSAR